MENNMYSSFVEKCEIILDGQIISNEKILRCLYKYYQTCDFENTRGIILHTGSICFDAISYIFSLLSNLEVAEFRQTDFASSLKQGDIVLHTDARGKQTAYVFEKIDQRSEFGDTEYMVLHEKKSPNNKRLLPPAMWNKVRPYYGERSFSSGKGMRKRNPDVKKFYEQVLGIPAEKIPNEFETYCVLVMPKERADFLSQRIKFRFNGITIPLLDIVPVSYFTDENEYQYKGNFSKTEAVIKLTSKVSVARNLMADRSGSQCRGMMIFDDDIVRRSNYEIPELFSRKKLKALFISTSINSMTTKKYLEEYPDTKVFACTNDFLLENWEQKTSRSELISELSEQMDILIDRNVDEEFVNGGISWDAYKAFKRNMQIIKKDNFESSTKDEFIIQAYSLFNLMLYAAFPLKIVDKLSDEMTIGVSSTKKKLDEIEKSCKDFPIHIKEIAESVLECLKEVREKEYETTEKEKKLREFIKSNHSRRMLIVVPKSYFKTVITKGMLTRYMLFVESIDIVTPSKIDLHKNYDAVIVLGDYYNEHFNVFSCAYAKEISVLLYDCEKRSFHSKQRLYTDYTKKINSLSYTPVECDSWNIYDSTIIDDVQQEGSELEQIDKELEQYIADISVQSYLSTLHRFSSVSSNGRNLQSDISAIVDFETGEHALLTKNYKGYMLDEISGNVKEVSVENITEGDSLIFTENNEDTHDIVDMVLSLKIDNGNVPPGIKDIYILSKQWKNELVKYKNDNDLKASEVAQRMKRLGADVATLTIMNWMDEDSHIVGPQDVESIRQIGILVGNNEMSENPQRYHDACRVIRHERRNILSEIGKMILRNYSGSSGNSSINDIEVDISALSVILRVEKIHFIEDRVSSYLTNHPIYI